MKFFFSPASSAVVSEKQTVSMVSMKLQAVTAVKLNSKNYGNLNDRKAVTIRDYLIYIEIQII